MTQLTPIEIRPTGLEPAEAAAAADDGALVIDIRNDAERKRRGEIPGALVVQRAAIELESTNAVIERLRSLAPSHAPVILVSEHGRSSCSAADSLRRRGIPLATDVRGGFVAWKEAGLEVVPYRRGSPSI